MKLVYRVLPMLSSLVVAFASFALSYVALRDVAAEIGAVPAHMAWLVPIIIDGGVICASVVIWSNAQHEQRREVFPFLVVAALVVVSVVVNMAHASSSVLARLIAALPPLVLLATLELVAGQARRALRDAEAADVAVAPPGTAVAADARVPVTATSVAAEAATGAVSPTGEEPTGSAPLVEPGASQAAAPAAAPAKKAASRKAPAKKAPARKTASRTAPAKKASAKRPAAKKASGARVARVAAIPPSDSGTDPDGPADVTPASPPRIAAVG